MSRECPQPRGGGRGEHLPSLLAHTNSFFFHLQVAVVVVAEAVRATTAARKATCHATVRRRVRAVVAVSSS
jgi:hypothetical protein